VNAPCSEGFRNLIEQPEFAGLFTLHPPEGFVCRRGPSGLPVFFTTFDLLTTLDRGVRKRLAGLPFFDICSKRLSLSACFAGTTLTEYAPLPKSLAPEAILDALLREHDRGQTLTVIKDLPVASPLLPEEDNAFASRLVALAADRGFIDVEGQALAYVRIDFASTDEYLARLSAGRRKDLRRKLKKRALLDVQSVPFGDPRFFDAAFLDDVYAMYLAVFAQSEIHFDLLGRDFFAALLQSRDIDGAAFLYRQDGRLAGCNICLIRDGMLIDKYIGFVYPLARDLNLYFISWMANLEYALEKGLHTYVAGWTDPEVKAGLGASFTFTRHLVRVKNPLLRSILRPLRHYFESDGRTLRGAT
jgi:hypothetical protein